MPQVSHKIASRLLIDTSLPRYLANL